MLHIFLAVGYYRIATSSANAHSEILSLFQISISNIQSQILYRFHSSVYFPSSINVINNKGLRAP
ncbi:unnamed protein product, partial [Callosobruchus maculatus]